jgi:hypothetical protein
MKFPWKWKGLIFLKRIRRGEEPDDERKGEKYVLGSRLLGRLVVTSSSRTQTDKIHSN